MFGAIPSGTAVAQSRPVSLDTYYSPPDHAILRLETPADHTVNVDPAGMDAFASEVVEPGPISIAAAPSGVTTWPARLLVRTFAALALVEALMVAGLLISRSSVFDTRDGRLIIESDPIGAEVWLDGRHLGTTPLSLMSTAGERSLRIEAQGASRTMKLDVASGQVTHARVDFVKVSAAAGSDFPFPSTTPLAPPAQAQITVGQRE